MITIVFVLSIVVSVILTIFISKRRHQPIKEDTHHYQVNLIPHKYRTTSIDFRYDDHLRRYMTRRRFKFIRYHNGDTQRRPLGSLVSWSGKDSKSWYDETNQFKHRMATRNTDASKSSISDPIGWTQRYVSGRSPYVIVTGEQGLKGHHLFERGHLVPYWITQDDWSQQNLVPMTQYTNKGFEGGDSSQLAFGSINTEAMLSIESEFKQFVLGSGWRKRLGETDIFQMYVEPVYHLDNFVPTRINYYFQLVTKEGNNRSFYFYGQYVASSKILRISVPVQMNDGTIVEIVEPQKVT